MNIFRALKSEIINVARSITSDEFLLNNIVLEIPRDHMKGDLATNVALVLTPSKQNPKELAAQIKSQLITLPYIAHIEVAGQGFINFTIKTEEWQNTILTILKEKENYGQSDIGKNKRINIDYVSANPTGPMHIGHARGAVFGDAMARLLTKCGFDVTKEFYINDYGSQVDILAQTLYLRYKEAITNQKIEIGANLYQGEYLIPVGKKLLEAYGPNLEQNSKEIKIFAVEAMMALIKEDLQELGVKHDVFFSETTLHENNKIESAINILQTKGFVYKGMLPPPKGKVHDNWESKEQLLFKSTLFGDNQDRPLTKADGSWSYFAAEIAYTQEKILKNYQILVLVLGADHSGYVKRLEAVIKSLSDNKVQAEVKICQLVNYFKNNTLLKMSKRAGSFATVKDVLNEVGRDVIRFMMLTRKNDVVLDFDLEQAKEASKDNPIFYVQYAYVRCNSVINNAKSILPEAYNNYIEGKIDISHLNNEEEIQLMKKLSSWPRVLEGAAIYFEPHRVAFYLQELASQLHSLWNLGKEKNDYKFIVENNAELTAAKLALCDAVKYVIRAGLDVIGIDPLEKM